MSKIVRLEAKNVLGIQSFELDPGKLNVILGDNEEGKTSILHSISKAFDNKNRRPLFLSQGEEEGMLLVDLDDGLTVERRFREDASDLLKVRQEGVPVKKKPESFLRSLLSQNNDLFNPIDFIELKDDKAQTEMLLGLIEMKLTKKDLEKWFGEVPGVSLEMHPIEILNYLAEDYYYDRRTLANRDVDELESEERSLFNQLPDNFKGDDWRNVVVGDLWKEVNEAERVNHYREKAQEIADGERAARKAIEDTYNLGLKTAAEQKVVRVKQIVAQEEQEKDAVYQEIQALEAKIKKLQDTIHEKTQEIKVISARAQTRLRELQGDKRDQADIQATRERQLEDLEQKVQGAKQYLEQYPEPRDIDELRAKAEDAERMKGFVPLWDNQQRIAVQLKDARNRANDLDQKVKLARTLPAKLLKKARLPVEGLGINSKMQITIRDEKGKNLPIRNLSTGRQLKLALDIARATAGDLKVICVDRFESMGPKMLKVFFSEIKGDGFQYFVTRVSPGELRAEVYNDGNDIDKLLNEIAGAVGASQAG